MKKALIVTGGWDGHEPKKCGHVFATILKAEQYGVEIHESMDVYADAAKMATFDLIVPIWTMGEIAGPQWEGLHKAVLGGTGIAGQHGGMGDAFRTNTSYQFMVGGQWVAHPDGIVEYGVKITKQGDPIVKGLNDFRMKSEQYYLHVDPGNEVLATTTFTDPKDSPWVKGTVMPVVWKRRYGQGKVFYSSLGHVAADFEVPEAREIQRRGMLWATR